MPGPSEPVFIVYSREGRSCWYRGVPQQPSWRLILSEDFTSCRSLRPSSGRQHTVVYLIQSGDDDYLMNETRMEPTTGTRYPSLFDKWHRIFLYMPSRIDTAVHTKVFIYGPQSWTTGGKSKCSCTRQIRTADLTVHSRTRQPPDHDDHPESQYQLYPGSSRGDLPPIGRIVVCD